jgi:hypothetical protein
MPKSRIDEFRMVDPVLTTVAQGYSNAALVADKLLPVVQVSKLKGKIPLFGKEAFAVRSLHRAMRSQSNRIQPSELTLLDYETTERDIEIAVDYLEEEESYEFYRLEQRTAKQLVDMMLLAREKEIADYVQNPNNFDNSLKIVIDPSYAFNDYELDINPLDIIFDGMSAVRNKIARYPNTMIIGDASYRALVNHPKIIEKVRYAGVSTVNTATISELCGIPYVHVGLAVHTNNGTDFSDVWNDNIVLAYVDDNAANSRSQFNPSYGYILQRQGKPEIDTYTENGGKIKVIRNTDNYCFKITGADAAFLINDTNH